MPESTAIEAVSAAVSEVAGDIATGTDGGSGGPMQILGIVLYLVVIVGALYFLMIRPQRKKTKDEKKLREDLRVGDEIVTIGGFFGRVVSMKEDSIVIESPADHSKHKIARWAIQANNTKHDDE